MFGQIPASFPFPFPHSYHLQKEQTICNEFEHQTRTKLQIHPIVNIKIGSKERLTNIWLTKHECLFNQIIESLKKKEVNLDPSLPC